MIINTASRVPLFFSALAMLLCLWGPSPVKADRHSALDPLRFGVLPYQSPRALTELYAPLLDRLETRLKRPVRLLSAPDFNIFLERGAAGEYDLILAPNTMLAALTASNYRVIARGFPAFRGGVVVPLASEIRTIADFRGKRVGAIAPHSYGGYLFFHDLLRKADLEPGRDLEIIFAGKVDSVIYGVLGGQFEAGVFRLDALQTPAFSPLSERLRVVLQSAEIPQFPFVVKDALDPATVAVIIEELAALSLERPEDRRILQSLQINGIEPATASDYEQFLERTRDLDLWAR